MQSLHWRRRNICSREKRYIWTGGRKHFAELHWEGRMERVGAHITVDGAHNPGAMEAYVESVKALDESERGEGITIFSSIG